MLLDENFLNLIGTNGTITDTQCEILGVEKSLKNNYKILALNKDLSRNDMNLLLLLNGITSQKEIELIIRNYHLVLDYNNIKAKVYSNKTVKNSVIKIYCDGACSNNPGEAGSGVVVYEDEKKPILLYGNYLQEATNNIAELNALYKALKLASNYETNEKILIFSDSKYSIDCITNWAYTWKNNGWTKKASQIKNLDLIIKTHELFEKLKTKIEISYVKGHNGILGNELADKMALLAIKEKNEEFKSYAYTNLDEVLKIKGR